MKIVIEVDKQYKKMLQKIANAIKAKITFKEEDFFQDLPEHVKFNIKKSREEIERGMYSSHDEVMKRIIEKHS